MKTVSVFAAIFLGLLAGCASHQPAKPAEESSAIREMEVSDNFKIEAAVYGYLLEKHPWESNYAAIFLDAGDERAAALIRKFPNHVPPLRPVSQADRQPNQAPIDRDTGKPAVLLTAKAVDPTNGVSEAVGTWYAGEGQTGLYAFVLIEMDGRWTIQSAK